MAFQSQGLLGTGEMRDWLEALLYKGKVLGGYPQVLPQGMGFKSVSFSDTHAPAPPVSESWQVRVNFNYPNAYPEVRWKQAWTLGPGRSGLKS